MFRKYVEGIALVAILLGGLFLINLKHSNVKLGAAPGDGSFVQLDGSTTSVTSTASALDTLVLARNYNRLSADICAGETNSTSTFIYFKNFNNATEASTTVKIEGGIPLTAGNCYQVRGENLYITDVWATSTLSGQKIQVTEK